MLEQSTQGSWAPTVARLRCLRGVDTLTVVGPVSYTHLTLPTIYSV